MRLLSLLLSAGFLASLVSPAAAQAPATTPAAAPAAPAAKVRVVTRNLEPFSFEKEGRRVGYAAELWDQLARETGLEYDIQVVSTAQEIIDALKNKTADVGVGAISVTAKREEIIDFSPALL
jgi:polar amino acid transport system substrate-binding protein